MALATLGLMGCARPSPANKVASPGGAARLEFHPSQLKAGRDSFVLGSNGSEIGYRITTVTRDSSGVRIVNEVRSTSNTAQVDMTFDGQTGMPLRHSSLWYQPSATIEGTVALVEGRVRGKWTKSSGGRKSNDDVSMSIPAGALFSAAIWHLLTTVEATPGARVAVPVLSFDPDPRLLTYEVVAAGTEVIRVPAGSFETRRFNVSWKGGSADAYVSVASPHRLILVAWTPGIDMHLAR